MLYTNSCKACRIIDRLTTLTAELAVFTFMVHNNGLKGMVLFIFMQPIILLAAFIVRKTLPMSHHMFNEQFYKEDK